VHRDFAGAPLAGTWYVGALANQLAGTDLYPGTGDIQARFNRDVDNSTVLGDVDWYYGLDGDPGSDIDFVSVVLHEFGHGLGFLDLIDETTGAWLGGFPDVYGRNLRRDAVGQFPTLTDGQRLAALTSGSVVWTGAHAVAAHGGNVPIHAPASYQPGSSISHWSTALTPNELMEPFYTGPSADPGMAVAPADTGGGVQNPAGHLLCYKVRARPGEPRHEKQSDIPVANDLGSLRLDTKKEDVLCLPAVITRFD
jgi:hypothetical protein